MKEILDKTMVIKEKLLKNEWKRDTDEGYLTCKITDYLSCIGNIDKEKLDRMLNDDLQHWKKRLETVIW